MHFFILNPQLPFVEACDRHDAKPLVPASKNINILNTVEHLSCKLAWIEVFAAGTSDPGVSDHVLGERRLWLRALRPIRDVFGADRMRSLSLVAFSLWVVALVTSSVLVTSSKALVTKSDALVTVASGGQDTLSSS